MLSKLEVQLFLCTHVSLIGGSDKQANHISLFLYHCLKQHCCANNALLTSFDLETEKAAF